MFYNTVNCNITHLVLDMVLKLKTSIFVNVGIKPAPRCWLKWNMDKLEPPNIKMREEILNAKTKKCMYTATFFS